VDVDRTRREERRVRALYWGTIVSVCMGYLDGRRLSQRMVVVAIGNGSREKVGWKSSDDI
jgi:hypothetical protein